MKVVAVVGSRTWPDLHRISRYVQRIAEKYPDAVIVSGGARGVDRTAEEAAVSFGLDWISYRPYQYVNMDDKREFSIETVTHGDAAQSIVVAKSRRICPPFFRTYGQAATFRNGWIVDDASELVAFHHGGSTGTADTIAKWYRKAGNAYVYEAA